ncbi:MAG: hypothetical protein ACI95S_002178, partial [Dinoroseobacter sp.]
MISRGFAAYMSNAAKDTSANDDVLASIRRLVAEES